MKLSHQTPTLVFYRAYVEGGEPGGVSPLAWAISQTSGLAPSLLERALADLNPLVVLTDEDDPLAVGLMLDDETEVINYCKGVTALVG